MTKTTASSDDIELLKKFAKNPPSAPIVFKRIVQPAKKPNPLSPMRFFAKGFDSKLDHKAALVARYEGRKELTSADIDEILKPLNHFIGQDRLKDSIKSFLYNQEFQRLRALAGLTPRQSPMHMVFMGPPGTGKTSFAKCVAKILFVCGYTKNGSFREAKRADLVGEYIGQSEENTLKILSATKGGVLFIDEAYALTGSDSSRDYGYRVIDTLVAQMDKPDFDTIIICAGYENEMQSFLASNTGLRSRFANIFKFDKYSVSELVRIAQSMAEDAEYHLSDEAKKKIDRVLQDRHRKGEMTDGGARIVRQMLDEAFCNQANRVLKATPAGLTDLVIIEPCDIPGPDLPDQPENTPDNTAENVVSFRKRL